MPRPARKRRGIFERPKGSGTWWISYKDLHGQRHREKVGARGGAIDAYRKRKAEIREGKFFPEKVLRRRTILFKEVAEDYVAYGKANCRDAAHIKTRMDVWIAAFGSKPAEAVTLADIEQVKQVLMKGREPATVNRHLIVLRAAYYLALRSKKIRENPAAYLKKNGVWLQEDNERVRYLTDDEREKLLNKCEPGDVPFLLAAMNTGIRLGGLVGLLWSDIDFNANVITVRTSKSGRTYRVPMNSVARDALWGLRTERVADLRAKDAGNVTKLPVVQLQNESVFPRWHGLTADRPSNWFKRLVKRAGVENLHFHDLRHDFGSRQAMAGKSENAIARLLGHTTTAITRRYVHFSEDFLRQAVEQTAVGYPVQSGTGSGTRAVEKNSEVA